MRRVYSSQNPMMVGFMREVLESHHIPCLIKNELLSGAAGQLPPTECWPEVWVRENRDYQRAREVIDTALSADATGGPAWECRGCGEAIEAQFAQCWSCGQLREDGAT